MKSSEKRWRIQTLRKMAEPPNFFPGSTVKIHGKHGCRGSCLIPHFGAPYPPYPWLCRWAGKSTGGHRGRTAPPVCELALDPKMEAKTWDSTYTWFRLQKRNSVFKVDLQQNAGDVLYRNISSVWGLDRKNFLVVAVTTPYEMFVEDIQTRKARNFWTLQNHNLQYSLEAGNKVGLDPLEPFNILVQHHLSLIPLIWLIPQNMVQNYKDQQWSTSIYRPQGSTGCDFLNNIFQH